MALFAAGLRLDRHLRWRAWRSTALLPGVVMPVLAIYGLTQVAGPTASWRPSPAGSRSGGASATTAVAWTVVAVVVVSIVAHVTAGVTSA